MIIANKVIHREAMKLFKVLYFIMIPMGLDLIGRQEPSFQSFDIKWFS